ncbi:MAG: HD domain-containing protein, partial [Bacteroidota bacterium]
MNESQALLLSEVRNAVADIFHHKVSDDISYHNLQHTQDVVAACEKMADYYKLNDEDRTTLLTAAWFHDTGFSAGKAEGHEDESIRLVTQFLANHHEASDFIEKVKSAIGATKMPQSPSNLI